MMTLPKILNFDPVLSKVGQIIILFIKNLIAFIFRLFQSFWLGFMSKKKKK